MQFQLNFVGKQNPLSAVNGAVVYKASITQRSPLNQAAFCWLTRQICVTDANPLQHLCVEIVHPQVKFPPALISIEITVFRLREFTKQW